MVSKRRQIVERPSGTGKIFKDEQIIAKAVTMRRRIKGKIQEFRVGSFCDFCGFEPNENALAMHQRTLEQMLAKRARIRAARRRF